MTIWQWRCDRRWWRCCLQTPGPTSTSAAKPLGSRFDFLMTLFSEPTWQWFFFKQFSAPKYMNNISRFTFFSASAHCLCHWELRSCANDSRQARSHLTQLEVWRMFFQRWPHFVYVEKILILFDNASHIRDRDDGISPLMAAVGAGRLEVVRHLVKTAVVVLL